MTDIYTAVLLPTSLRQMMTLGSGMVSGPMMTLGSGMVSGPTLPPEFVGLTSL